MAETLWSSIFEGTALQGITRVLIVFIVLSFSMRAVGTLFPAVFQYGYTVQLTVIVNTAFSVIQLLFFLFFLKGYAVNRKPSLRAGTALAVLGAFLVTFIYLKNLDLVFGLDIIPPWLRSRLYDAVVPLAASCFSLAFFGAFRNALLADERGHLARATESGMVGAGIFLVLHLIVLVNFLKFKKFLWLEHMPRTLAVGTTPLVVIASACLLFFYFQFYLYLYAGTRRAAP